MKILIVDDSEVEIQRLKSIVERAGHTVSLARNGEEAIVSAQLSPDLIFMDVVMPIMDGFKATRIIKKDPTTQHIPVILVSTKSQAVDVEWAKRQGASHLVAKPYSPSDILHQLALHSFGERQ